LLPHRHCSFAIATVAYPLLPKLLSGTASHLLTGVVDNVVDVVASVLGNVVDVVASVGRIVHALLKEVESPVMQVRPVMHVVRPDVVRPVM